MALFKYLMTSSHDVLFEVEDMLAMRCAENADIVAPFDCKLIEHDGKYELASKHNSLFIKHININKELIGKNVKAGTKIGTAMTDNLRGEKMGYILVAIKDGYILDYIYFRDVESVETKKVVEEQPKPVAKASNKKEDKIVEDK